VAAALEVFGERGFAATKLTDVARRAGVTKAPSTSTSQQKRVQTVVRETIVPVIARRGLGAGVHGQRPRAGRQLVHDTGGWWGPRGRIPKLMLAEPHFSELTRSIREVVTRGTPDASVIERGSRTVSSVRGRHGRREARHVALLHAVVGGSAVRILHAEGFKRQKYLDITSRPLLHSRANHSASAGRCSLLVVERRRRRRAGSPPRCSRQVAAAASGGGVSDVRTNGDTRVRQARAAVVPSRASRRLAQPDLQLEVLHRLLIPVVRPGVPRRLPDRIGPSTLQRGFT